MDRCKHVVRLRLGQDHSILNPQKWHCVECSTTDSVWACLKCSHVACGRFIEEHFLKHFQESQHPLAMEVRELDVFCFACGDYVLNDNAEGDLKLLRGALSTVRSPGRRSLRSSTGGDCGPWVLEGGPQPAMQLALRHRRKALLGKMLQTWIRKHQEVQNQRKEKLEEARRQKKEVKRKLLEDLGNIPPRKSARLLTQAPRSTMTLIPRKFRDPPERLPPPPKKPSLLALPRRAPQISRAAKLRRYYSTHAVTRRRHAPGVTGLRNLGNTCYMNSILQVLSHLQKFRECFLTLDLCETEELLAKTNHSQGVKGVTGAVVNSGTTPPLSENPLGRMGKAGCWNLPVGKKESVAPSPQAAELVQPKEPRCSTRQQMSLCHELHTLFRVMWSGRWTLVSPFAMLHSVWNLIPAFRGYDQQDAQEFLCELLDKVQQELDTEGSKRRIVIPITKRKLSKQVLKVLNTIFHGQLLSQVTCLSCKHKSNTVEPFWDLSLEFPERYHSRNKGPGATAYQRSCSLIEMLSKFTEMEALEGNIYACNHCNKRRRKSSHKPLVLSEARKQLLIYRLPQVLRLHLKRFRWSGRNHREKIGVHVAFDQVLNIKPYCCTDSGHSVHRGGYTYDLSAVVMHHGKGFGSGHYTAYCYNTEGGFWVHCNDSEMKVCSVEEVCNTQAYILFYTQRSA
ncbi:ubiquitin carboxyl-terminal hydrolase 49 [Poecilia latipinna]|uniref:Ubiquitin carboxyl-terminal hydrolase n=3 Tax=Poecilia TaxID=8080 RepID=A0A087X3V5_POEFO|nr:PREDICTED: ubiquitin carboxyl-terminal hydrolase 49 [Poecilia formosa]XP_007570432.1 PREDICTED: ubiquitin carboxyl-terminal hydrolase 49 [Poecilia formosa]XP_014853392.1 PREDICTED: ubiquitin carboxyl-terminal hydrolase 49 [Poecilia mexicana]XP_014853393.1 PREDICTED: ubiquitin carboxyl-terminal hydrolase 49 [Poecilia mexicana]XP_014900123.1 PREDICTED: ubiquitin carboxyl-terminal hydrolase 49 [Poecilia latipinna]XP_014900124.1 PREDICTED: ubiquitin carboxyl-terminal hydrolase 49 [Poecilia lati